MDVERDRRHFDHWAPRYDRSLLQPVLFSPTHVSVLNAATEAGLRPGDVLDLGCGTGRLLERAAEKWPDARLIGVDLSSQMIAEARRKHAGDSRFRFEVGDAAALPLEAASVDAVFSTISFHHWGDQLGGVREVARVLRSGGLFVLADIQPPLLLRPVMKRFHASGSRRRLFDIGGLEVIEQHRPLRMGRQVLITAGRKG